MKIRTLSVGLLLGLASLAATAPESTAAPSVVVVNPGLILASREYQRAVMDMDAQVGVCNAYFSSRYNQLLTTLQTTRGKKNINKAVEAARADMIQQRNNTFNSLQIIASNSYNDLAEFVGGSTYQLRLIDARNSHMAQLSNLSTTMNNRLNALRR